MSIERGSADWGEAGSEQQGPTGKPRMGSPCTRIACHAIYFTKIFSPVDPGSV